MIYDVLKILVYDGKHAMFVRREEGGFELPATRLKPGSDLRQAASRLAREVFKQDVSVYDWEVVDSTFDEENLFSTYTARGRTYTTNPHPRLVFLPLSSDWRREPIGELQERMLKLLRGGIS